MDFDHYTFTKFGASLPSGWAWLCRCVVCWSVRLFVRCGGSSCLTHCVRNHFPLRVVTEVLTLFFGVCFSLVSSMDGCVCKLCNFCQGQRAFHSIMTFRHAISVRVTCLSGFATHSHRVSASLLSIRALVCAVKVTSDLNTLR